MKYPLILAFALLTGCATVVPITQKFPDVPAELLEKCPPLATILTDTTVFSELTKSVTTNYTTYYECVAKTDAWNEWYQAQRKIFNSIK